MVFLGSILEPAKTAIDESEAHAGQGCHQAPLSILHDGVGCARWLTLQQSCQDMVWLKYVFYSSLHAMRQVAATPRPKDLCSYYTVGQITNRNRD